MAASLYLEPAQAGFAAVPHVIGESSSARPLRTGAFLRSLMNISFRAYAYHKPSIIKKIFDNGSAFCNDISARDIIAKGE